MKTRNWLHSRPEGRESDGAIDPITGSVGAEGPVPAMDEGGRLDDRLSDVVCGIRNMEYLAPPDAFLPSVMQAVRSRRLPWWIRLSRWGRSQKSITFTPLQVMPALVVLCAVCAVSLFFAMRGLESGRHRILEASREATVVLTFKMPEARSVSVIGSFNNWRSQGYEMKRADDQASWSMVLKLPAGRYEYAFMVDGGRIVPDPGADLYQEDGFGNRNAVMIVGKNGNENSI